MNKNLDAQKLDSKVVSKTPICGRTVHGFLDHEIKKNKSKH